MNSPTHEEIKKARIEAGLTQKEAAALVGSSSNRTWQYWEYGIRNTKNALFALDAFLVKNWKNKTFRFTGS